MSRHNFRGNFKVQDRITTTLSPELQKLAWDKTIRWSNALETGVKQLAYGNIPDDDHNIGETIINETEKSKIEQMKKAMFQMQQVIDKLQEDKDVLDEEKREHK